MDNGRVDEKEGRDEGRDGGRKEHLRKEGRKAEGKMKRRDWLRPGRCRIDDGHVLL